MNKYTFISLYILLFVNVSYSQSYEDFNYVTTSIDGSEFYVYIEKNTGNTKEVWVKNLKPTKTIKNKKGKYVKVGGSYDLIFYTLYCSQKKYDATQIVSYNKYGNVTKNSNSDFQSYDNRVIPGSVMSLIFDYVCNNENEISNDSNSYVSNESNYNGTFKFVTTFNNPPFEMPLRKLPNLESEVIYYCPKNSVVNVIDNSNKFFFIVNVNGYIGYISTGFLLRKF